MKSDEAGGVLAALSPGHLQQELQGSTLEDPQE